jgi:ribonuclease E
MAKSLEVAGPAAGTIQEDQLERVRKFTREPILLEGETIADLAPGTARRLAVEAALAELDEGREDPSQEWRQRYSLLLGLERLLDTEPVGLADGTTLTEHQVDVLSGTLAALTAEVEGSRPPDGSNGASPSRKAGNGEAAVNGEPAGNGAGDAEDEIVPDEEEPVDWEEPEDEEVPEVKEDPGASRRFWFEHATGSGKTVAALGFVDGSRTGGVLILTHRRNLVDQFIGEISERGYKDRLSPPILDDADHPYGPVTVETYQWFVRNAKRVSNAYAIVVCDEAHTALGEKTSACIRNWPEPVFIGMTATGALIARHVADLFPTQTSRFDLARPPGGASSPRFAASGSRRGPVCGPSRRSRCGAVRWTRTSTRRSWPPCSTRSPSTSPWRTSTAPGSGRSPASSTPPEFATRTTSPRRSGRRT